MLSQLHTVRLLPTITDLQAAAQPTPLIWDDGFKSHQRPEWPRALDELGLVAGVRGVLLAVAIRR